MACSLVAVLLLAGQLNPSALVPLYEQALADREKEFGPDHPKVARSASDLGLFLRGIGDREGAARHLKRALEIDQRAFGAEHPITAEDMENLASVVAPGAAAELYRKAAGCSDAEISARNWARLGALEAERGESNRAVTAYRNAITKQETASGPHHQRIAVLLNDLAQLLEPKAAEPLIRRALAIEEKALGSGHPALGVTLNNLASVLIDLKRLAEAEAAARRGLALLEATLGADHPRVAIITSNLGRILRAKGDFAGARRLYNRALEIDLHAYGPEHPDVAEDLRNLADLLIEMGETQEAKRLLNRAEAIRKGELKVAPAR